MNWLRSLWRRLTHAHSLRVKLKEARHARAAALSKMASARRRGDDRGYGRAYMEMRAATSDCLRAEVGLRA